MSYFLGIDIGSTTMKTALIDEQDQILYKSYERHFSQPKKTALKRINELSQMLKSSNIKVCITGSAGMGISQNANIPFVQEVFAASLAVEKFYPKSDVVIELGGEDAKIIFLQGGIEERMNGTCAGGTGAFIDQMASLMNISTKELDELSAKYTKIYPIASRCGVFAKTDIQPLLSQGANKEDIAASIFEAVVNQTISGLAHGRQIKGNVLFLGGPIHFLDGLKRAFVKNLNLDENSAFFPELGHYFVALGTAIFAKDCAQSFCYDELITNLNKTPQTTQICALDPLFIDENDYKNFKTRHDKNAIKTADINAYSGKAYLGIDCGSTTIKIVLISQNNELLYHFYASNQGNSTLVIKEELQKLLEICKNKIEICKSAATGYGEELMCEAFGVDFGIVETMAHYTAARFFNKNVDFIIDIGGQDIKCFYIVNGEIDSIVLNEACSSGCGSFLQAFANSMNYDIDTFAKLAIKSKSPASLGSRCTVFMNSSVKQAQKEGASIEDISAGLAISVVKNALYKVIRVTNTSNLGKNIVVQGGTFLNDAVLRAFERELGIDVIRLKNSELMGAYGAALFAKDQVLRQTSLINLDQLLNFSYKSKFATCHKCENHCALTINIFSNNKRFISGNRCERGAGAVVVKSLPNLIEFKQNLLATYRNTNDLSENAKICVGLPFVLNMYELLPFWAVFFRNLGCKVKISHQPSDKITFDAAYSIPTDTICYPAKSVHSHIEQLAHDDEIDIIFYPCMSYSMDEGISDNTYNCPIVAYYPELIKSNVASLQDKIFLYPHIGLENANYFAKQIFEMLKQYLLNLTLKKVQNAIKCGFDELKNYKNQILTQGQKALNFIKDNEIYGVVLGSRPYHIDPKINKGIDKVLNSLGFAVISEDALPLQKHETKILNQWVYHARMVSAAHFVCENERLEFVQLVSFGCGIDAVTTDELKEILRSRGKFYTQIKIDEITNMGAMKIRLKSLQAMIKSKNSQKELVYG